VQGPAVANRIRSMYLSTRSKVRDVWARREEHKAAHARHIYNMETDRGVGTLAGLQSIDNDSALAEKQIETLWRDRGICRGNVGVRAGRGVQ